MVVRIDLPKNVRFVIDTLKKAGYDAYAVGGCVRDAVLGITPKDWDITTSALPKQIKSLFKRTVDTGIQHGTVTVLVEDESFEVTTYRIDGEYADHRHPDGVEFTTSLKEDLSRRDFTINAMAYNDEVGFVDEFGGMNDLKNRIIRCVGTPHCRFDEDALRMMRAVRFAAQLDFSIEKETMDAICDLAPSISHVSAERIREEIVKTITTSHPEKFRLMYETGITKYVLPEFDVMMETKQNNPHHIYTVGEHTLRSMQNIENDRILRIVMLFHDVSKPECRTTDSRGIDHFAGHPYAGSDRTRGILRRLKFDNDTIRKVCQFVKYHDYKPYVKGVNLRYVIGSIGPEYFPDMFKVKRADISAQGGIQEEQKLEYVDELEELYNRIIEAKDPLVIKDLDIDGNELMELGFSGKAIGEGLSFLLGCTQENPMLNRNDMLKILAKEYLSRR